MAQQIHLNSLSELDIMNFKNCNINFSNGKITISINEKYNIKFADNKIIITPNTEFLETTDISSDFTSENDLNNIDIKGSKILECIIKDSEGTIILNKKNSSFRSILIHIWKQIGQEKILKQSTFNFKLPNEQTTSSYNWCNDINMSFQNKDADKTLKEILNIIKLNMFTINLSIKLTTGKIIHYNR
tara:strand:+ start:738 stop:1298 length:561 start_codon:yes stop_codon:yes gene_type:complete